MIPTPAAPEAGPAPVSSPFVEARQRAVDHHLAQLRNAIQALRGLGQHEVLADLLEEEASDTIVELSHIRRGRKAAQPRREAV